MEDAPEMEMVIPLEAATALASLVWDIPTKTVGVTMLGDCGTLCAVLLSQR